MSLAMFGADPATTPNTDSVSWWDAFFSAKDFTPAPQVVKGLAPTTAFITGPQGTYVPASADVQALTAQMAVAMDNANQALLGVDTSLSSNAYFAQTAQSQLNDIYNQYLQASGSASPTQYRAWVNQVNAITNQALALKKISNPPIVTGATNNPNVFDASKAGPGKTPVPVSTQDQIKAISDQIFGSISSGAKTFFELKAMQQMSKGQPVQVPSAAAIQASGGTGSFSTTEKLAVGGIAVVGIGLLIFALARR